MEIRQLYALINGSGYSTSKILVLKELLGLSKQKGYAFCSVGTLAEQCGMKPRTLQYHLSKLKDDGVLKIAYGVGRNHVNHYKIQFAALTKKSAESCTLLEEEGCNPLQALGASNCTETVQNLAQKGADSCTQYKEDKFRQDVRTDEQANEPAPFQEIDMAKHSCVIKIWSDWNEAIASKPYKAVVPIPQNIQSGCIDGRNAIYEAISNWIDAHGDWEELWDHVSEEIRSNKYFDGERTTPSLRMMFVGRPATHRNGQLQEAWRPTIERVLEGDFAWGQPRTAVNNPQIDVMKKTLAESIDKVKERGFETF